MLCVWFVYFYVWPDMVLNQRQVLVIVSVWEPYLGSLFGDCLLCQCLYHTGLVSGFHMYCFVVCSCIVFLIKKP